MYINTSKTTTMHTWEPSRYAITKVIFAPQLWSKVTRFYQQFHLCMVEAMEDADESEMKF